MTSYDAAMIGVVIAGMIWGALRGITWQIASIASLVVGYLVAKPLSAELAPHFPGDPIVARSLAMLVVYAAVSGAIFGVAWLIRAVLRRLKFEAFDRHLGMILGGLEGALVGLVVTLFVASLFPNSRAPIFNSPTGHLVAKLMDAVGPVLPEEARNALAPFWDEEGLAIASDPSTSALRLPDPGRARASDDSRARSGRDRSRLTRDRDWFEQRWADEPRREVAAPDRRRDDRDENPSAILRELYEAGKSQAKQALSDALDREIQRASNTRAPLDDRNPRRR